MISGFASAPAPPTTGPPTGPPPAIAVPARESDVIPTPTNVDRPADVLAAREKYEAVGPNLGTLSVRDARRAQRLVHKALEGMPQPRIFVNRRYSNAESILRSDKPIPTMFDLPPERRPYDYKLRLDVEKKFDTYGRGIDEGRSVYGSVQFADQIHDVRATINPAHPDAGRLRPNLGVGYYGPVSLVLKPEVWQRATVQPGDSYNLHAAQVPSQPAAAEHVADVVTERVVSHFDTRRLDGAATTFGVWGHKAGAALKSILWKPTDQAVEGVRQHLASTAFTHGAAMIEAAVRTADRNDIAEIRVMRHPNTEVGSPAHNAIRRLRYHAKKLGIPVHQTTVPANQFPYGSARHETLVKPEKAA